MDVRVVNVWSTVSNIIFQGKVSKARVSESRIKTFGFYYSIPSRAHSQYFLHIPAYSNKPSSRTCRKFLNYLIQCGSIPDRLGCIIGSRCVGVKVHNHRIWVQLYFENSSPITPTLAYKLIHLCHNNPSKAHQPFHTLFVGVKVMKVESSFWKSQMSRKSFQVHWYQCGKLSLLVSLPLKSHPKHIQHMRVF